MLSIIVPVYNSSTTLHACLASCFAQTFSEIELIVIDGGSSDGSVEIIRSFSDRIAHWVSEPDGGIYDAWNKGLRRSSGEWVAFLGSDDVWSSDDSVAKLMAIADYPHVNFVSAKLTKTAFGGNRQHVFGEPWSKSKMKLKMGVAHAGMLHHRSLFNAFGEFDTRYKIAGDYEFLLRAANGIRAGFVDEIVGIMGGGGVSSTQLTRVRNESFRALYFAKLAGPVWAFMFLIRFTLRHRFGLRIPRAI